MPEITLRRAIGALAVLGIAVATYITIAESGGGSPACVAGGGGCETVAESEYSELAGVNVAAIGIAGYALILVASLMAGDTARFAGFVLGLIGFGFSLYLTYLELFVIDAVCQWCLVSAGLMTTLFILGAIRVARFAGVELSTPGGAT